MVREKAYKVGQTVRLCGSRKPHIINEVRFDEARGDPHYRVGGNENWFGHAAFDTSPLPPPIAPMVDPGEHMVARALRIAAAYDEWCAAPGGRRLLANVLNDAERDYAQWLSELPDKPL